MSHGIDSRLDVVPHAHIALDVLIDKSTAWSARL